MLPLSKPVPLAKKNTTIFKDEWDRLLMVLDIPRSLLILDGALSRKDMESLLDKVFKGSKRFSGRDKSEVVAAIAELFRRDRNLAYRLVKSLDKSSIRERHIVSSISEEDISKRIQHYKALNFRRERSRIFWALIRDPRRKHRILGEEKLSDLFLQLAKKSEERHFLKKSELENEDESLILNNIKKRLKAYEYKATQRERDIKKLQSKHQNAEEERSKLLVEIGVKERTIYDLKKRLDCGQEIIQSFNKERQKIDFEKMMSDKKNWLELENEKKSLKGKLQVKEKKLLHMHKLIEDYKSTNQKLKADEQRNRSELKESSKIISSFEAKVNIQKDQLSQLQKELRECSRLNSLNSQNSSKVESHGVKNTQTGIFVDATNISASARREHGDSFDFVAALKEWSEGRELCCARIYLVDAGNSNDDFQKFCRPLREAGYEIRYKKPRRRSDGSMKADWDMDIALDIIEKEDLLDSVILASGDGDFIPLVKRLKRKEIKVELCAYRASLEVNIAKIVNHVNYLDGLFRFLT